MIGSLRNPLRSSTIDIHVFVDQVFPSSARARWREPRASADVTGEKLMHRIARLAQWAGFWLVWAVWGVYQARDAVRKALGARYLRHTSRQGSHGAPRVERS